VLRIVLLAVLAAVLAGAAEASPTSVQGFGVRMALPPDWHGHVYVRDGGADVDLQAATVPLTARDDDIASHARRRMHAGDVLIALWEYQPPAHATRRWRQSFPPTQLPVRIGPKQLSGMEGIGTAINTNLRIARRYFQMIVVFGRGTPNRADYARANRALAGLRVAPMSRLARARLLAEKTRLRLRVSPGGAPAGFERVVSLAGFGRFLWRCSATRIDTAFVLSPGPPAHVHAQTAFRHGDATVRAGERVVVLAAPRWRVIRGRKAIVQISRSKGCTPWVDAFVRPLKVR